MSEPLRILYENHRGELRERLIIPGEVHFGSSEWHPEKQWLLDALDVEKNARRTFAFSGFRSPVDYARVVREFLDLVDREYAEDVTAASTYAVRERILARWEAAAGSVEP